MIDREALSYRLYTLRVNANLTQMELSERLNVSPQAISKWENAKNIPDLDTLLELASFYQVSMDALLGNVHDGIDPVLNRNIRYLRCPSCGGHLIAHCSADHDVELTCSCGRTFIMIDGVIDFGSHEKPGEQWSDVFHNYQDYKKLQSKPTNPRYDCGAIPSREVRWQRLRELKPRVMVDIACGTCTGVSYDLKRIDWPCTLILTDLSHRVQKYNRRWFTEEVVNPHVDILYLACDCTNLPIGEDSIDVVLSYAGYESMGVDMLRGFQESFRVLKPSGHALYSMSVVEDLQAEETKKWLQLYHQIPWIPEDEKVYDIKEWKELCSQVGFRNTSSTLIYKEMPAPASDTFPFSNEVMQWMAEIQCDSQK